MNQKIQVSLLVGVIILISMNLISIISSEIDIWDKDSPVTGIWTNNEYIEIDDVVGLVTPDREIDLIRFYPNNMDGYSSGKGTWPDGYSLTKELKDGTRIWEEFSNNGTLLKSIKIYDEPEKEILILLK